eukprot:645822_1
MADVDEGPEAIDDGESASLIVFADRVPQDPEEQVPSARESNEEKLNPAKAQHVPSYSNADETLEAFDAHTANAIDHAPQDEQAPSTHEPPKTQEIELQAIASQIVADPNRDSGIVGKYLKLNAPPDDIDPSENPFAGRATATATEEMSKETIGNLVSDSTNPWLYIRENTAFSDEFCEDSANKFIPVNVLVLVILQALKPPILWLKLELRKDA